MVVHREAFAFQEVFGFQAPGTGVFRHDHAIERGAAWFGHKDSFPALNARQAIL
jgi:hypothetical protein